jgi:3-oxoacyl-[acyl-carrier-protein] synthase-3
MKAYIKGISTYLPERILTNEELVAEFPEWTVDKVAAKVGINSRHIAAPDETAGDMAVKAAEALFAEYEVDRNTIDFILLCTQSPDYPLPTTACLVQNQLKIPTGCGALDFNLGCSGYVYGLSLAKGLIVSGIAKNVLFLTSEVYTKQLHPQDKGNRTIFGDAATATLIATDGFAEIGNFCLGTDGAGAENLILRSGGRKNPLPLPETVAEDGSPVYPNHIQMNGAEVFNFTLTMVPPLVEGTLKNNALENEQINLFVFHQANKFMLNTLRKLCQIDPERFYYCLEDVGNTVSNTIPIALKRAQEDASIKQSFKVLLAGFGVGYSWGGCVLQY